MSEYNYSASPSHTCAVVDSLGVDIGPRSQQYLGYLGGADIAGPEEGGPGGGVPHLQAGSSLHQQVDNVRPSLPGRVVQGRTSLGVLNMSDIRYQEMGGKGRERSINSRDKLFLGAF